MGFVAGVTPDRWARAWGERVPRRRLDLVPLGEDEEPIGLLRAGELRMCFVRLPGHRARDTDGLHVIVLYDEQPVVVVGKEHPVAAYDEIDVADLADEHLLQDPDGVPAWRDVATEVADGTRYPVPDLTVRQAVESVAADAGILVLPLAVARLHRRRDVTHVPVTGVPTTSVALAWLRDDAAGGDEESDAEDVQRFIGVVRGRTANSSRG